LVGVTGSVGKTTTKEFLAALLATTFRTGKTAGNRNSEMGLPAELCNQPDDLEWMVAELGMSHAGELDRLGRITVPDALVYTVVAPVHLEFFDSLDGIAEAKAELIPHLRPAGLLVLNGADERVAGFAPRFPGRTILYGSEGSDLWIEGWQDQGLLGASFTMRGPRLELPISWTLAGRHQAENLLAAAAAALALGVPATAIPGATAALRPAPRRGELHRTGAGVTIVDDSYDASPVAMAAVLDLLATTPGRRIAVLGEMLELGDATEELHRGVGARAATAADLVITVGGEPARALGEAAGAVHRVHAADADEAARWLAPRLASGDVVLVKGSRGIGLEGVVDRLRAGEG
jgi:UDP-N-acetylmuramoyl-tripeptide--D-alanyl-D-alanine ligase